ASRAISKVKWGRIDKETTTNVGMIQGGTARNSVPETVSIKAEARSHNREKMKKRVEMIKRAFNDSAKSAGARVKFEVKEACSGYKLNEKDPFLKGIVDKAIKIGIKPELVTSGGASDANALAGKGFKVLDISYGGEGAHTTKEKLRISWMRKTTEFLVEYLRVE
ncbi:MAG: M20/M25/M40 family metallo-hydrolase, partial [Patescibacteria group bacterium]